MFPFLNPFQHPYSQLLFNPLLQPNHFLTSQQYFFAFIVPNILLFSRVPNLQKPTVSDVPLPTDNTTAVSLKEEENAKSKKETNKKVIAWCEIEDYFLYQIIRFEHFSKS